MRSLGYNVCVLVRWAILTVSLSTLLFLAAGTTQVPALWTYMAAMSTLLLVTMLAVDPKLAEERVHPGMGAIDPGMRIAASCLFLLTQTTAAVDVGRLHTSHNMPAGLRFVALILFMLSGSLQAWAMALNPFFSPGVRLQKERGHHVIDRGPYRYLRHPGYLAMLISIPTTAVAIGSWLALVPATGFAVVIVRRAKMEDEFLKKNLFGYIAYANQVPARLFPHLKLGWVRICSGRAEAYRTANTGGRLGQGRARPSGRTSVTNASTKKDASFKSARIVGDFTRHTFISYRRERHVTGPTFCCLGL
jgi:protein-S-isoprenylcysteine O-methyltransferase Ste14